MNINIGRLKVGDYRNLTEPELKDLKVLLENSTNLPAASEEDEEFPKEMLIQKTTEREKKYVPKKYIPKKEFARKAYQEKKNKKV